jgi:hypothetical protein
MLEIHGMIAPAFGPEQCINGTNPNILADFGSLAHGSVCCLRYEQEQEACGDRRQVEPSYSRKDLIDDLSYGRKDRLCNLVHDDVDRVADVLHHPGEDDSDEDGDGKDVTQDLDE